MVRSPGFDRGETTGAWGSVLDLGSSSLVLPPPPTEKARAQGTFTGKVHTNYSVNEYVLPSSDKRRLLLDVYCAQGKSLSLALCRPPKISASGVGVASSEALLGLRCERVQWCFLLFGSQGSLSLLSTQASHVYFMLICSLTEFLHGTQTTRTA